MARAPPLVSPFSGRLGSVYPQLPFEMTDRVQRAAARLAISSLLQVETRARGRDCTSATFGALPSYYGGGGDDQPPRDALSVSANDVDDYLLPSCPNRAADRTAEMQRLAQVFRTHDDEDALVLRLSELWPIHVRDIRRLTTPDTCLNDTIIFNYVALLEFHAGGARGRGWPLRFAAAVPWLAHTAVLTGTEERILNKQLDKPEAHIIARWAREVASTQPSTLVMVVQPGFEHWITLVIDIQKRRVLWHDSLLDEQYSPDASGLLRVLSDGVQRVTNDRSQLTRFDKYTFQVYRAMPQQPDTTSCGLFALAAARAYALRRDVAGSIEREVGSADRIAWLREQLTLELLYQRVPVE